MEDKWINVGKIVFKTPSGRKWHICKSFDAFGPTSWCGIERMWRWVEEAEMGQVAKEEICRVCLKRTKEEEGEDPREHNSF